jgi:acetylornithine deacetylase/succinyl-diaminopimelate desuccinylase-like protein
MGAAVASLRDEDGRVLIDGFYDRVRPPTDAERRYIEAAPAEDEQVKAHTGVERFLGGATGSEFQRRLQVEPTLNVNGIHAGYGGPGMKTVLPASAMAKLDFRLVPAQEPHEVFALLRAHLDRHGFADVRAELGEEPEWPARVDPEAPFLRHAAAALEEVYGSPAVIVVSSGGSGPLHPFVETLGVPMAMLGISYPGGRVHSPNEHVRWQDVHRGTYATVRTLERWAGIGVA